MTGPDAIPRFLDQLQHSLSERMFVGLRLSCPINPDDLQVAVDIRLIELKGEPRLSIVVHEPKQDITQNVQIDEGNAWVRERVGAEFRSALLRTTQRDWQLHCPAKRRPKLVSHKPSTTAAPSLQHDAAKQTLLGPTAAGWLHALTVTDASGRPKPSTADKHRQIHRYTEILHHLAADCGWVSEAKSGSQTLKVADMGCGKGYLTFAAWHLFHRVLKHPVKVLGVESRPELVDHANGLARKIDAEGLEFIPGDIASVQLPPLDALIALHACNTATDNAIQRGIELDAKLIVVAPCCHQALRPELGSPAPFTPLLQQGLFKERMAEWLSDGLRTLFLEWAGYQTKVIEFVTSEHTPKNLMITATRKSEPFKDNSAKQRIIDLKSFFKIKHHALDPLLEPQSS